MYYYQTHQSTRHILGANMSDNITWICFLGPTPSTAQDFLFQYCLDASHPDFAFIVAKNNEHDLLYGPGYLMTLHCFRLLLGFEKILALPENEKPRIICTDYSFEYYFEQIKSCPERFKDRVFQKNFAYIVERSKALGLSVSKYFVMASIMEMFPTYSPIQIPKPKPGETYMKMRVQRFLQALPCEKYKFVFAPETGKYKVRRYFNEVLSNKKPKMEIIGDESLENIIKDIKLLYIEN